MHETTNPAAAIQKTLARIHSLSRRHQRDREGCFWIDGIRNFVQAFDAKLTFDTVVYSPILLKSDMAEMLARRLRAFGVRRLRVTPEQFRTVCTSPRASGIGAILRQNWTPLEKIQPLQGLCWLVIEEIRSPGNLGTIFRTAEACGVSGVLLVGSTCDPFDPAVVRASMAGMFHLPLVRTTHEKLRNWATRHGIQFVGLSPKADRLWTDLPCPAPLAFVIGEERRGLSERLSELCRWMVRLPMTGRADSLNVAVAAGVMMYEMVRRTQVPSSQTPLRRPAGER